MKSVAMALALLPLAAAAATITVNTSADNTTAGDGHCTLREAIANVNAAADTTNGDCVPGSGLGDSVVFSGVRTINLTLGELLVQRDVAIGGSVARVRIGAKHQTRVFEIAAGTTNLSNVIIQNGQADRGSGILVDAGASIVVNNCAISRNSASVAGGGLYNDGGTVILSNSRFTGNKSINPGGDGRGGAIYSTAGQVSIDKCIFRSNVASGVGGGGFGGAIQNGEGGGLAMLEVSASKFLLNVAKAATGSTSAVAAGGAIQNVGIALVTASVFNANVVRSGNGGAVENRGDATFESCRFVGNLARYGNGGGIENWNSLSLENSTLKANAARLGDGGAIENQKLLSIYRGILAGNFAGRHGGAINSSSSSGNVHVAETTVKNNHAEITGGGVKSEGVLSVSGSTISGNAVGANSGANPYAQGGGIDTRGPATFTNSTITGNRSIGDSGAVLSIGQPPEDVAIFVNCTIVKNYSNTRLAGGAAAIIGNGNYWNTIVAKNIGGDSPNCEGTGGSNDYGHNLGESDCYFPSATDILDVDPRLAPLADNGGPTATMALCTGIGVPHFSCTGRSPAIDAGDDGVFGSVTTDQRGLSRLSGAHVDIGAYEVQ